MSFSLLGLLIVAAPAQATDSFLRIDLGMSVGAKGVAISPNGTLVLVALEAVDTVRVIDAATNQLVIDIPVGDMPEAIDISPDSSLAYVTLRGDDAIQIIDLTTLAVGPMLGVLFFPTDVAFAPDGLTAYVAGYGSGTISVIDVATSTVTTPIVGLSSPQSLEVSPDGATLWVVGGSAVVPIDTTSFGIGTYIYMNDTDFPAAQPRFLDLSPDGSTLVVGGDDSDKLYLLDTATETVVNSVDVGDAPYSIAFGFDGTRVYAGRSSIGGVAVVDIASNTMVETVPTDGFSVEGLEMSPRGDFGYASSPDDDSLTVFGEPVTRVSGVDRYAVAVNISQRAYPSTAPVVYIATGSNYPDALSAGPAAAVDGGPLLLTPKSSVPAAVLAEIVRLNPAEIYIVGGTGSVSDTVRGQLEAIVGAGQVHRLAGADRYSASRAIVAHAFATANTVYITTGRNYPDALSASAIGASQGIPVLLVDGLKPTVDAATLSLLATLNPTTIKIAGGPGSVSSGIETQLSGLYVTIRLSGADRYEASLSINQDAFTGSSRVFLATGATFPDALAGAPWAGIVDAPLFSVPKTCVPANTLAEIISLGAFQVTLLGGPGSLTKSVFDLTACP